MNLRRLFKRKLIKSEIGVNFLNAVRDSYTDYPTKCGIYGALRYLLKKGLIPEWEYNIINSVIKLSDEEKAQINY